MCGHWPCSMDKKQKQKKAPKWKKEKGKNLKTKIKKRNLARKFKNYSPSGWFMCFFLDNLNFLSNFDLEIIRCALFFCFCFLRFCVLEELFFTTFVWISELFFTPDGVHTHIHIYNTHIIHTYIQDIHHIYNAYTYKTYTCNIYR